ncbi:hypothetical protein [Leifsonia sp. 22587]|uniref:hypothetical protein n=1 Tax=Leifsonia sp. 22587 TaxID=3453946 RepID=UPI003F8709C1
MARRPDGLVAPESLDDASTKKVYRPLQWWPLRVMNPWHKFAVLVAQNASIWLISLALGRFVPEVVNLVITQTLTAVTIIAVARSFRGWGEPVAPPRAWWRLSARPLIGWWLGALYLLSASSPLFDSDSRNDGWVILSVEFAFLGLAFLNSSIRLTAQRRRPQA